MAYLIRQFDTYEIFQSRIVKNSYKRRYNILVTFQQRTSKQYFIK